jgi:hypothetical protein
MKSNTEIVDIQTLEMRIPLPKIPWNLEKPGKISMIFNKITFENLK